MDPFVAAVRGTIHRFSLLKPGDSVLCAVSGGPDSVALLRALRELSREWPLSLSVLHVNHGLRGTESDADADFVETLCRKLGIPVRVSSRPLQSAPGENLQDQARKTRYRALFDAAAAAGSVVATGHNLQDQAETLLMKLARGSGPTGLAGIFPAREISRYGPEPDSVRMVRPLLERGREEILDFLERRGQPYREDSSNRNLRYDRNWVRHRLIPELRTRLNPALIPALGRTARLLQEVGEFLDEEGRKAFRSCRARPAGGLGEVRLKVETLFGLAPALRNEVIRHSVKTCKGDLRGLGLEHVDGVLGLVSGRSGRRIHLPGGIEASLEFGHLRVARRMAPMRFSHRLPVPGEVIIPETGRRVVCRRQTAPAGDADQVLLRFPGSSLTVRSRLSGDRYPDSRGKKLKRLFQQHRIPRSVRDTLVVVEEDGRLLWVEGLPADPRLQARPGEKEAVRIQVLDGADAMTGTRRRSGSSIQERPKNAVDHDESIDRRVQTEGIRL